MPRASSLGPPRFCASRVCYVLPKILQIMIFVVPRINSARVKQVPAFKRPVSILYDLLVQFGSTRLL